MGCRLVRTVLPLCGPWPPGGGGGGEGDHQVSSAAFAAEEFAK